MKQTLENLELDLKELKYLMDVLPARPELAPVVKRRISEMRVLLDGLDLRVNSHANSEPVVDEPVDEKPETVLGERLQRSPDLSRSLSLNDSFRFSRGLFEGDAVKMNAFLAEAGKMGSLDEALEKLSSEVKMDDENEALVDFTELLKKHFG